MKKWLPKVAGLVGSLFAVMLTYGSLQAAHDEYRRHHNIQIYFVTAACGVALTIGCVLFATTTEARK
jgi:hypothetical protein